MLKRLGHVLAMSGVASRRASEKLIFEGRVTVNGKKILQPQHQVEEGRDRIKVDGVEITRREKKRYYLCNKPVGYLCTSTPGPAKIVLDLFAHLPYRLFTVGRLDRDTSGLIIVTNDGVFAHHLMHPSFNVTKEYLVKVNAEVTADQLKLISEGVIIDDSLVKPLKVKKMRRGTLKISVGEGKKHEVRLLVQKAKLEIFELTRIRIGSLHLGHLPVGAYRELKSSEIDALME